MANKGEPIRLPIAQNLATRDGTLSKDALMVNALLERKGEQSLMLKRPGLTLQFDLVDGQGQGMVCWKNTVYIVQANTISQGPTSSPWPDGSAWTKRAEALPSGMDNTHADDGFWIPVQRTDGSVWLFQIGALNPYVGGSTGAAYRSTDGRNWNLVGAFDASYDGGTPFSASIVYSDALAKFILLVGYAPTNSTSSNIIYSSSDGYTWVKLTTVPVSPARVQCSLVAKGDYLYIIGGITGFASFGGSYDEVWRSSNGVSWTLVSSNNAMPLGRNSGADVGLDGKIWCFDPEQGDSAFSSVDGITWVQESSNITHPAVASGDSLLALWVPFANRFYAAGQGVGLPAAVYASVDGINWDQKTTNYGGGIVPKKPYHCGGRVYLFVAKDTCEVWEATNNQASDSTYSIPVSGERVDFTNTGGAAATEYLFLKTQSKAFVLTFGNPGAITEVTDEDYPAATVPGVVYLDGYICVMDNEGTIYNSDLEDPTSWNALNFVRAEQEPDFGIALAKHQNYLVAFKQTTIEFFYDAANETGSPFSRLPSSALNFGCAHGASLARVDGNIFFLSRTSSQAPSVHYFPRNSLTPVEVASEDVRRFLGQADLTTVKAWAARLGGHSIYVLSLVSEGITLVYDSTSDAWSTFTLRTASAAKSVSALTQANGLASATSTAHGFSDGDRVAIAGATPSGFNGVVNITVADADHFTYFVDSTLATPATGTITATGTTESYFPFSAFVACGGKNYVQHESTGDVYEINPVYADDNGVHIDVRVRTPKFDVEQIAPKTMAAISIVGERAVGDLLVRYTDDDYATFSKYRPVNLNQERPQLRGLGRFRRRALELRYTGSGFPRLVAAEIEIGG